jgi:drug/metabolite transporter (DMT)-like permease
MDPPAAAGKDATGLMDYLWILSSIAAAFFQSLRLGALKQLNQTLSIMVTSYVRVLFGLPFLLVYLLSVMLATNQPLPPASTRFLIFSCSAAITQFLGTAVLVRLFQIGNFAVGTMLQKTDVLMTAVIGSLLFSELISAGGWLAILVTAAGVMLISAGRLPGAAGAALQLSIRELVFGRTILVGLLTGLLFALSYLSLREAILTLDPALGPVMRSAFAAVAMTAWSFLILGPWLLLVEREGLKRIRGAPWLCTFLGFTSALGTIFWFIASALANVSYVAAVAQVQTVFTLAISWFYFGERIGRLELAGIAVIVAGLLLFRVI